MIGIYIHIPFCYKKCPYCNFYSIRGTDRIREKYIKALKYEIINERKQKADSLYIGGGTPSRIETRHIIDIVKLSKKNYRLDNAEITIEANPIDLDSEKLRGFKKAGINRLSIGMQSANQEELNFLGRQHTKGSVSESVKHAKNEGIENISVDLMLGVKNQTVKSMVNTIEFIESLNINHVSTYILKIEHGTYFNKNKPALPSENQIVTLYLKAVEELGKRGFKQYEISNFAKEGGKSKHNLKYWSQENYLGFGVSAHSFMVNKRYAHSNNILKYIDNAQEDLKEIDTGGDREEWLMLKLRLNEGATFRELSEKGYRVKELKERATALKKEGYVNLSKQKISLTPKGMLVQNSVFLNLIDLQNKK